MGRRGGKKVNRKEDKEMKEPSPQSFTSFFTPLLNNMSFMKIELNATRTRQPINECQVI
jgi:hypothetical protein